MACGATMDGRCSSIRSCETLGQRGMGEDDIDGRDARRTMMTAVITKVMEMRCAKSVVVVVAIEGRKCIFTP